MFTMMAVLVILDAGVMGTIRIHILHSHAMSQQQNFKSRTRVVSSEPTPCGVNPASLLHILHALAYALQQQSLICALFFCDFDATWKGVSPLSVRACGSAQRSSETSTIWRCPFFLFGLFDVDTLNKTFRYQMDIPAGLPSA